MHSNAGTVGEIVDRTCTHRAFYEKERNSGGMGTKKIHIKSGVSFSDTLIQFSRCAYAGQCMWQIEKCSVQNQWSCSADNIYAGLIW